MDKKKGSLKLMDKVKDFLEKSWGGIIGWIIALIIACTGLYRLIVSIVLIGFGIWAGNYFQKNKDKVKKTLKDFIDKI